MRTPRYGGSIRSTTKVDHKNIKRGDVKYVTTSMSDRGREEEKSENTEAKFRLLESTDQILIMAVTGQSEYFVRFSNRTKNIVIQLVSCLLDAGAQPNIISKDFKPT